MVSLGTLGGGNDSQAFGINDDGQQAGIGTRFCLQTG
jgi:hypothetical protein